VAALRPAAIAIHDNGHVLRKAARIELLKQPRFITRSGLEEIGGFHGDCYR